MTVWLIAGSPFDTSTVDFRNVHPRWLPCFQARLRSPRYLSTTVRMTQSSPTMTPHTIQYNEDKRIQHSFHIELGGKSTPSGRTYIRRIVPLRKGCDNAKNKGVRTEAVTDMYMSMYVCTYVCMLNERKIASKMFYWVIALTDRVIGDRIWRGTKCAFHSCGS